MLQQKNDTINLDLEMKRNILLLILAIILNSCWPCKVDPIIVENGSLTDSILNRVPYQQGEVCKLQHINGVIINFETLRETYDEFTSCDHCCDFEYHYQVNKTALIADYPLFDIEFLLDNQDTIYYWCSLSIGKSGFTIPISEYAGINRYDSIKLGANVYYDVLKLKSNYDSNYDVDSIYVDSLYYNYTHGILKILMSNKESYEKVY